jgi:sialate O-acetylesterase
VTRALHLSASLLLLLAAPAAMAQLRLPLVLNDGAVLQRGRAVPVWGRAAPGADVSVDLGGARRTTRAGADGRWRVELPPMEAGGPYALTVASGGERVEVADLLVGDVWVLSGQSNMEWTVKDANDAAAEMAAAEDPQIRHFRVPQSFADAPEDELAGGSWVTASPATVGDFSAVGYFFARGVRAHHDVPIGLLHTSWGGSRIEPWMSAEMLGLDADGVAALVEAERAHEEAVRERLRARIGELPEEDGGMDGEVARWAASGLDDAGWAPVRVPAQWEALGYDGLDGVAWYRTTLMLSGEEALQGVALGLGMIDDDDVTWVNGVEVGRTANGWNRARRYEAPASALRAGENTLAIRVVDHQGGGGIAGADSLVYLETADGTRRSLAGDAWRFKVGAVRLGAASHKNQVPMALWNKMVHPLTPFPVAGVLWYQGESNGDRMEDAAEYGRLFRAMIAGWRAAWGQPDLPFLWAQLANFHAPPAGPDDAGVWATLREGQSSALALPNTAEAVLLDAGEADDIHPRDKQTVGRRLALAARRMVYGEDALVASGPRYRTHEVAGGRVTVTFDHVGGGLTTRGGAPLGGFAVAAADGVWRWAEARIEGDRVVLWSDAVPAPAAVRYAWADNPEAATLTNAEGLPAAPFRTDGEEPSPAAPRTSGASVPGPGAGRGAEAADEVHQRAAVVVGRFPDVRLVGLAQLRLAV